MLNEEALGAYNFNILREVIHAGSFLKHNLGAEIGVFDGGTSMYLLSSFSSLRLISVDPYLTYHEYEQSRLNEAEQRALARLSPFGERSIRIKETSVKAADLIDDGVLDFVFIDADHSYDPVKADMEAWYPKIRPGGLFAGHDYRWPGVEQAVNEWSTKNGVDGLYSPRESDVWYFVKPQ